MKPSHRSIIITFTAVLALTALLSRLFPASASAVSVCCSAAVGFIAFSAYFRLCPVSRGGFAALAVFWAMLTAGVVVNAWYFSTASGGTPLAPVLHNEDARIAWEQMCATAAGTESTVDVERQGYGDFLAFITLKSVPPIDILLYTNALFILLSIVLTGATAARTAGGDGAAASRMATAAMIATGGVAYYLCAGTILIKDALCCLLMSMILFALFGKCRTGVMIALICMAMLAGAMVRRWFPAVMAVAVTTGIIAAPRRRSAPLGALAAAGLALFFILRETGVSAAIIDNDGTSAFILDPDESPRLNSYEAAVGTYENLPIAQRLVRLPFSLAVQALTPLPWAWGRDVVFGPTQAYAHCSFAWYAELGLILYFMLFYFRRAPLPVRLSATFALVAWCGTAFVTGGTVSRYCLPWLPFIAVPVSWLVCGDRLRCRAFRYWAIGWCAAIALGLTVVFTALNHYSPSGWEAQ